MNNSPLKHSISISVVEFRDGSGSKSRPVYVLNFDNDKIKVFAITSKFKNKSKAIQKQYFEIIDWQEAGLRMPSWIDTIKPYYLKRREFNLTFIGKLTLRDTEGLRDFLRKI